jgi:hypothetical protein
VAVFLLKYLISMSRDLDHRTGCAKQFTHWSLGTLSFENEVTEFPKAKSKLLHQAGLSKVPPKTMAYKNNISIWGNKLIDTVSHLAWV